MLPVALIATLTLVANAANREEMKDMRGRMGSVMRDYRNNFTKVEDNHMKAEGTITSGSLVVVNFASDNKDGCGGDAISGFGYTLGSCNQFSPGIIYESCTSDEAKNIITYTYNDCGSDCISNCELKQVTRQACDGKSKMSCHSNVNAWEDFELLTYHFEYYFSYPLNFTQGCDGSMDEWQGAIYFEDCINDNQRCEIMPTSGFDAGFCDKPGPPPATQGGSNI